MRQLHASDSQGVERKREVVVRPDGSKVIRVEKRRRTYNDDHGDAKQAVLKNKRFLIGLCILVLLVVGALAGTYMYRLTSFNTEEFAGRRNRTSPPPGAGRWKPPAWRWTAFP